MLSFFLRKRAEILLSHTHNEQGLQDAAKLEQSGHRDAVHCSEEFFEIVANAQAHEIVSRRHAAAGLCLCAFLYL